MKGCLLEGKTMSSRDSSRLTPKLFLLIFFTFLSSFLFAQTSVIKGNVNSGDSALAGVTIQVKGTQVTTQTDQNGRFAINAPSNATLIFTSVGYVTREIKAGDQTTINVQLTSTSQQLNDVVVVGYTTQKKQDITGAISSVTSKDIENVHGGATVSSALAGKVSGLSFRQSEGRPGASAGIQVRNMGTPLYVIDGVPKD